MHCLDFDSVLTINIFFFFFDWTVESIAYVINPVVVGWIFFCFLSPFFLIRHLMVTWDLFFWILNILCPSRWPKKPMRLWYFVLKDDTQVPKERGCKASCYHRSGVEPSHPPPEKKKKNERKKSQWGVNQRALNQVKAFDSWMCVVTRVTFMRLGYSSSESITSASLPFTTNIRKVRKKIQWRVHKRFLDLVQALNSSKWSVCRVTMSELDLLQR